MRKIKIIGFAVSGLLTAMALVDAPSAIAESTALCKQDESPCKEGNIVTHLHAVSIGKVKLLASGFTGECNALFLGDTTSGLASPLVITGSFTYSNCGANCTIVEENGPATIKALKLGHETANVTIGLLLHLTCSGISCFYSGEVEGTYLGPLLSSEFNGSVSFQEKVLSREKGVFCPASAKLDAAGTPLEALYISS